MKRLGDFIMPALARRGLKKTTESALVCFYAGEWGKSRFKPLAYSKGVLKVSVASSSAAQTLQMEEEKLISYLNGRLGKKLIKSVRIVNSPK